MSDRRDPRAPTEGRKPTLSNQLHTISAKLNRVLVSREQGEDTFDRESLASTVVERPGYDRSVSRGREGYRSSGRGGMGNIKPPPAAENESYTVPVPRGRDPTVQFERQATFSTGRGGAGNINRPPPSSQENDTGNDVLTEMPSFTTEAARSRSQGSPSQRALSTGRGGAGNIIRKGEPSTTSAEDRYRSLSSSRSRGGRNEPDARNMGSSS
ncbi:hypothetical protein VKT23_018366 [Stygiomarasmius scandens]|uniref:Uncharacterized protein n=1 Tax=Marasmiellus scandens TaxID=2682957 RepID=A0ABR1ISH3_9AGAR